MGRAYRAFDATLNRPVAIKAHGPGHEDALAEVEAWLATHRDRPRAP